MLAGKQRVPTKKIKREIRSLRKNLQAERKRASRVARAVKTKAVRIEKKASRAARKAAVVGRKAAKAERKASALGRDMGLLRAEMEKLSKKKTPKKQLSEYNLFMRRQLKAGKSFRAAVKTWKAYKRGATMPRGRRKINAMRRVISRPKIVTRTRVRTIIRRVPVVKTRTVVKRVPVVRALVRRVPAARAAAAAGWTAPDFSEIEDRVYSIVKSEISRHRIAQGSAEAVGDEKLALDLMTVYFQEVHRLGLKRRLELDDVVQAYFEVLSNVRARRLQHAAAPGIEGTAQNPATQ